MLNDRFSKGLVPLVILLINIGCDSGPVMQQDLEGIWGGDGIHLEFETRGASILYDCAEGNIDKAIVPDKNSDFKVDGWYSPTAGPETIEGFPKYPARHEGTITGSTMTLTVKRLDTGKTFGPFTLRFGDPGKVIFCR